MNTPYYTKAESDAIEANLRRQYNYGSSEYRGFLAIADTPTLDGWYWATEIGTYTNAGGIVTVTNKINMIEKDGVTFRLNAIDSPTVNIVNSLTSTSTTEALSANQGRVLDEKIEDSFSVQKIYPNIGINTYGSLTNSGASLPNNYTVFVDSVVPNGLLKKVSCDISTAGNLTIVFAKRTNNTFQIYNQITVPVVIGVNNININEDVYIEADTYIGKLHGEIVQIKQALLIGRNAWYSDAGTVTNSTEFSTISNQNYAFSVDVETKPIQIQIEDIDKELINQKNTLEESKESILKLEQINDQLHSSNYLDPTTFRYGNFYWVGQNGEIQTGSGYGCTDYIQTKLEGFTTIGAGLSSEGISSYAVFDKNKVWLRNGQNTNHYNYVEGDEYVVFIYANVGSEFALTKAVTLGNTYSFEKYSKYAIIDELEDRVILLESSETTDVSVKKVLNGLPIVYANTTNFTGTAISNRDTVNKTLDFNSVVDYNSWIITPLFIPKGSNLVHVKFSVEFTKVGTTAGIYLIVAQQESVGGKYITIGNPITQDGTYDITFDPAYFAVYEGYTNFYVWINNQNISEGQSCVAHLTNLQVLEYDDSVNAVNIDGDNAKELFESTDGQITEIKNQLNDSDEIISPTGLQYELGVTDLGVLVTKPIIPNKTAFIGNSLLGAFGYGMAASEEQYDYYSRINAYILTIKPSYTFSKKSHGNLESATTEGELVTAINTIVSDLDGDETLVSIQLGDNVNTTAKNLIFNEGNGCLRTLQAVRTKCPNARVVWMGMWYGDVTKYNTIINSCKATGSKFITFSDLISDNTRNVIGGISRIGLATRTLDDVINVVANTPTNITVTFTVGATSYSSTLDVISHSLSNNTLTYNSEYYIINSAGVASHPNDEGFRLIANRFLYQMKLTTNPELY